MSDHRELEELAALYALDALDASDRTSFEAHLASGCERCLSTLRDAQRVSDELLLGVAPSRPAGHTKEALMARVRRDARSGRGHESGRAYLWPLAVAASVLIALALGLYTATLRDSLRDETARRQETEQELSQLVDSMNALTSPRTLAISLDGQEAASSARATAFLDPENRRLFLYVENLPPLAGDRTYQIWLLVNGTPVSVGTFDVGADGGARLDGEPLPLFEGRVGVAVTNEPAGGVPQPTGPMVLLGS